MYICAIAKNENLYIREWVEYYKKLGISKIFLYDNNDIDGEHFEDVINDYIQSGFVEVIDKRGIEKGLIYTKEGINLQTSCYIDCYENRIKNTDWVAFVDIDEFLVFKDNIYSFINKFNGYNCILVPWVHYDDNDEIYYKPGNIVNRFTRKSKEIKYHAPKSIVKGGFKINNKLQTNLIHIFTLSPNKMIWADFTHPVLNHKGDWCKLNNDNIKNCLCIVNHYKTKTLDEFIKRQLGRHWGTSLKHAANKRNYFDCIRDFYKYNYWNNDKAYFLHKDLNYNAIISLTSWKKRIDTTYKTINNLKNVCGNKYKIVLTLSIDEFPNKEKELPKSLLNTGIEIIWVQKNYGCYKKVVFTMQKYPNIPIISADDDCIYKYDYATELYSMWLKHPTCIITSFKENKYVINDIPYFFSHGRATLFPPSSLLRLIPYLEDNEIISRQNDDSLYGIYAFKEKIKIGYLKHSYDQVLSYTTNENALTYNLIKNKEEAKRKFIKDKKIFISKLNL